MQARTSQIYCPDGSIIDTTAINGIVTKLMDTARVAGLYLGIINDNKAAFEDRNIQLSYGLGWGIFKSAYGRAFF
ncbi:MAG TPA: hypothetical protein VMT35_14805 [Ignavibacteriaceae bacterium]|nr:hypothetical protein [Ignavibacteriaceae bacterium]